MVDLEDVTGDAGLHERILAIFADVFQLDIASDLEDIGRNDIEAWDSINHLRLVAEIEESFGVALSDEEVTTIASLGDVEKLLIRRGRGNTAQGTDLATE